MLAGNGQINHFCPRVFLYRLIKEFIVASQMNQLKLKLLSIISIVCFIMHDKLAINKVKTVRLCLKWMINHLLYCENKITHVKVSKTSFWVDFNNLVPVFYLSVLLLKMRKLPHGLRKVDQKGGQTGDLPSIGFFQQQKYKRGQFPWLKEKKMWKCIHKHKNVGILFKLVKFIVHY